MKKIAYITKDFGVHGISTVVLNFCTHIDSEKYRVDLLSGTPINNEYRELCNKAGVRVLSLGNKETHKWNYYASIFRILRQNKYDIVHVHGNSALMSIELLIAKICRIKIRIAHSHNTSCTHMKVHKILLPLFKRLYTKGVACGYNAGKWLFGNDFEIVPNLIDTKKFLYSDDAREEIRNKYGIDNRIVIGHIGCFNAQKNHKFILDIYTEILKDSKNYVLLLVGDGPDFSDIKKIVQERGIEDMVFLTGNVNDPWKYYSAMDLFLFPSLYEGFGLTLLEAQINGIKCIISDMIPMDSIVNDSIIRISLNAPIGTWKDNILSFKGNDREVEYEKNKKIFNKYDIVEGIKLVCGKCYE